MGLLARSPASAPPRWPADYDPNGAPVSARFERVAAETDAHGKLFTVRPLQPDTGSGFESGGLVAFVRRFPELARRLGFEITAEGNIRYPDVAGLNARLDLLPAGSHSGVRFAEDVGPGVTDAVTLARLWVEGKAPVSRNGREGGGSLHYHDMFVHGLGFVLLPAPLVERSRERVRFLMELHDHPRLSRNGRFRALLRRRLEEEFRHLDNATADIVGRIAGNRDPLNLFLTLAPLGREGPGSGLIEDARPLLGWSERGALARALEAAPARGALAPGEIDRLVADLLRRYP